MSNLAHHDVEQGRFAQADDILADALRFSEERDIPICSMWQRGVQARLRLLQGRWREAEQDAPARCWRPGTSRWAGCGRTSCSDCSPPAGRRRRRTRTWTSCGGWRRGSTCPACSRPAAAALAEQAWITRRPDPRLDGPRVAAVTGRPAGPSGEQLRRWARRLAAPACSTSTLPPAAADRPVRAAAVRAGARPVGRRLDRRSAGGPAAARRARRPRRGGPGAGPVARAGVAVPRGPHRPPGPTRPG